MYERAGRHGGAVPRWMPDGESDRCFGCTKEFDSVNRRHHCRRCGLLYCDTCSEYKSLIHPADVVYPPDWDSLLSSFDPREPLRTCRACWEILQPQQEELSRTTSNAAQATTVDRNAYERYMNVPIQFDMRSEIAKATHTLLNFCEDNAIEGSDSVPKELIAGAWGLAFVTTMQAGFFFSGRMGSGLVIARTPDGGWSAPSAVCTAGAGWGLQIGGEVTDMLIVLNSQDAVDAFASTAQLSLGTELSLALGPMGRSAETNMTAGDGGVSAVFSYAHSKGFFVGIALHACVILARPDCNEKFYGKRYETSHILSGAVHRPVGAEPLYSALDEVLAGTDDPAVAPRRAVPAAGSGADPRQGLPKVSVRVSDADPARFDERSSTAASSSGPYSSGAYHYAEAGDAAGRVAQTRGEQEQIDADLALAIALNEEEQVRANAAARARAAEARAAEVDRAQESDSWFSWGASSENNTKPPAQPLDDGWATERIQRLASADQDASFPQGEELKPMSKRRHPAAAVNAHRPVDPYYDDDEATIAAQGPAPTSSLASPFRADEEVTL